MALIRNKHQVRISKLSFLWKSFGKEHYRCKDLEEDIQHSVNRSSFLTTAVN